MIYRILRAYFPASKWDAIREEMLAIHSQLKLGTVDDFSIFLSAVIDEKSFDRISGYIEGAKADPNCTIIAGGNCDKSKGMLDILSEIYLIWLGYFVEPTIIVTTDPNVVSMREEIFGPVLTVYVYDDDKMDETIELMSENTRKSCTVLDSWYISCYSEFALTGAIYCAQESLVQELSMKLRQTAGNFYINDKVIELNI